jgi:hypothetical protein
MDEARAFLPAAAALLDFSRARVLGMVRLARFAVPALELERHKMPKPI